MAQLWLLKSGKISRKNIHKPIYAQDTETIIGYEDDRFRSPHRFVPTPSELQGNKFRMVFVGDVSDDSPEAREAAINTPVDESIKQTTSEVADVDVTKMSGADAIDLISKTNNLELLKTFTAQEVANKPKVRATVIKAITSQQEALTKDIPA